MDKTQKALKRLTKKQRENARSILSKLLKRQTESLDIKKLKGHNDIFRVRKGEIRIIYRIDSKRDIFILTIERKSDKTYRF